MAMLNQMRSRKDLKNSCKALNLCDTVGEGGFKLYGTSGGRTKTSGLKVRGCRFRFYIERTF